MAEHVAKTLVVVPQEEVEWGYDCEDMLCHAESTTTTTLRNAKQVNDNKRQINSKAN